MKPEGRHEHRPAVTVVTGIVDVLQSRRDVDAAPHMGGVIALDNAFAAVVQGAVAEEKPIASISDKFGGPALSARVRIARLPSRQRIRRRFCPDGQSTLR